MRPQIADVVIIGAGFAGAATAYNLAMRGVRDVVLLEREAVPGMHASGRNAALAFQVISDPMESRLAVEGTQFIAEPPAGFSSEPLLQRRGSLLIAQSAGIPQLEKSQHAAQQLGLSCELMTGDEAVRRVPALRGAPFTAAFFNPHDGVVDIHALLQGYLAGARAAGVRVAYQQRIEGLRLAGNHIEAVETADVALHTHCVVNAAGAWAGELGKLAGVGTRSLAPRRRHLFQTIPDCPVDRDWPFVWHNDIDIYFRPEGDGLLMSPCDATPHPAQAPNADSTIERMLAQKVGRAFPALASARVASAWACLRTFARDERFVIGRDPEANGLIWVGALGGHGMTTSAAVGRLGAQAVLGEDSDELRYFSPERLTR